MYPHWTQVPWSGHLAFALSPTVSWKLVEFIKRIFFNEKFFCKYLLARMNDVNDGGRSDLLNIFYISSRVTSENHQDQSFWFLINLKPVSIGAVDALGGEVVELLEVSIHHNLLLVGVLERLAPGVKLLSTDKKKTQVKIQFKLKPGDHLLTGCCNGRAPLKPGNIAS